MLKTLRIGLMLIVTCTAVELRADVINFDDLAIDGGIHLLPVGYQGFQWSNFYVLNAQAFTDQTYMGPNGYVNGVVSGPNVAYNGYGDPALVSSGLFDLNSAYFNAAWNDGLTVTVTGKLAGNLVATQSFVVNTTGPATLEIFNGFQGVDELDFQASGGTHHDPYNGIGTHFAMDNFEVTLLGPEVPEPSRLVGLAGLAGVAVTWGLIGRLRRRRSGLAAAR